MCNTNSAATKKIYFIILLVIEIINHTSPEKNSADTVNILLYNI